MQLTLFPPAPPDRPRRRVRWRDEMRRLMQVVDDQRARDRRDHEQDLARVDRQLEDVRSRLVEVERATIADIAIAPRTAARLRAFAGNGS